MGLGNVFRALGFWTNVFTWNEPSLFRVRLRRDLWLRGLISVAIGFALTALLLFLFAINRNPPHVLWGAIPFLLGLAIGLLTLCHGESSASGRVRVCQEGIHRRRTFAGFGTHLGAEEVSWPYEALRQCVLVPGNAIGQPFSVLVLAHEYGLDAVGVPAKTDLNELMRFLAARGVNVTTSTFLPPQFTSQISLPLTAGAAVVSGVLLMSSLGFYVVNVWMRNGAELADARPAAWREAIEHAPKLPDARPLPLPPREKHPGAPPNATLPSAPPAAPPPTVSSDSTGLPPIPRPRFPSRPTGIPAATAPPGGLTNSRPATNSPPPQRDAASGAAASGAEQTRLVGGSGGFPFAARDRAGRPMVGFRYAVGSWAGKSAISQLDPLFDRGTSPARNSVVAREGYVVGGLQVEAAEFVTAVRVIFVRQSSDGELEQEDYYQSDWIGTSGGADATTLGSGQSAVLGIYGRRGAVIDAIGLELAK